MHLYTAAVYTNKYLGEGYSRRAKLTDLERSYVDALPHLLESYHYINSPALLQKIRDDGKKVFLDSGAFSAWTTGVTIDLKDYCAYVQRNDDLWLRTEDGDLMISVLDGIGDPLQTYRNQLSMEALGVTPLPCFHYGEDERYLDYYAANYNYITIGGMVGKSKKQLIDWLDMLWEDHMTDSSGRPKAKFHAFGITAREIMYRYPWYSVDSSSWIQAASFGFLLTPEFGIVQVSEKSRNRHIQGQHLCNFSEVERQRIISTFTDAGFTEERLSTCYESRVAYNLRAMVEINKLINASEVHQQQKFHTHKNFLFGAN
jgi:hypothetical protein